MLAILCGPFCKDNPIGDALGLNEQSNLMPSEAQNRQPITSGENNIAFEFCMMFDFNSFLVGWVSFIVFQVLELSINKLRVQLIYLKYQLKPTRYSLDSAPILFPT